MKWWHVHFESTYIYMCATSNISLHVKSLLTQLVPHGISNWDIHSSNFLPSTVEILDICLYTYTHTNTYIPSHFTSEKGGNLALPNGHLKKKKKTSHFVSLWKYWKQKKNCDTNNINSGHKGV